MIHRRASIILFLGGVIISLVIMGCEASLPLGLQATTPPSPTAVTEESIDLELASIVSAEGVVAPDKEAVLSFKISGQVEEILVSEGDDVLAGHELAKLQTRDLHQAILRAEARLRSSEAELAKAEAGARPEEIVAAEAAVSIAEAGVKATEGLVAVAEGNLAIAEADVKAAQDAVEVARGNVAAARAGQSSAQASLDKLVAGATARDIEIAEKRVELAQDEWGALRRKRDVTWNVIEGDIAAAESRVVVAQMELAKVKDPARPEDVAMAQAEVAQARADVQTARAQLAQAQIEVAEAEAGAEATKARLAQAQAEVESAKAQAMKAQAELDLVKAGTRQEDIAVAEAAVAQAEAALVEAQNALEDAVLTAPFGGTVGELLIDEGELVTAHLPVMRLGDLSQLRVETKDLSEVDVDQISLGQEVTVTVDALGVEPFTGTVSQIAPVATDHRGDTVYTVTIDLGVGPDSGLRWGMSTFVEIQIR